ncbi:Chloroperoxidase [Kalmanozyma brasiliensis GHG001]|uniref:Heme haloperoxidase family profile domain-containing protein n=1 Tax=Kalmanozyma brasiliensis (strain GHG001) TaxID=1365824 RepID=V5EX84_KALBG|nr:Chloroperoxidase [Kalmanozyma brasiliensis GHG001]EST08028.1 Chloroperoxidase [Kalmanozyma brasiliensis GHG001]
MKLLTLIPALSVLLTGAAAFPSYADLSKVDYSAFLEKAAQIKGGKELIKRATNDSNATGFEQRTFHALIDPASFKFDAKAQYIDLTSDEHKFIPPGPNDIRGPCPGLNLLANHGYLNRNGVTNLAQGIDAIGKVFGVEADLGLALNAYAVVFNGNILDLTWSIGGPYQSQGLGKVTDILLGPPGGINAHNIYEGDASIVRQDYYQPGANHDNVQVHLPYFQDLLDLGNNDQTEDKDVYTAELMLQHKSNRWHQSVAVNPLFFNSAFGGLVVTTAAERFVAEFAANNTADANGYNRLYLDEKNLLAFFSVERTDSGLKYTPGHEHLIPGWTRRPLAATFGLDDIVLTLLHAAAIDPSLLSVGGNAGQVNTFTGVDVGNLTGGVYNFETLSKDPQALACYLYQIGIEQLVPTQINLLYKVAGTALDFVAKNLKGPWQRLATAGNNPCNSFNSNIAAAYNQYPGAKIETTNGGSGILPKVLGGLGLRKRRVGAFK